MKRTFVLDVLAVLPYELFLSDLINKWSKVILISTHYNQIIKLFKLPFMYNKI